MKFFIFVLLWIISFILLLTLVPIILYIFSLFYNLFFKKAETFKATRKKTNFILKRLKEFKGEIK